MPQQPERDPAAVGARLDAEVNDTRRAIPRAQERWQSALRGPSTQAGRQIAQSKLEALEELRRHGAFFGVLRLEEEGLDRTFYIGRAHLPELDIVGWRHALGRLFYELEPGDDYDRPGGDALLEGEVVAKARLELVRGELEGARWEDRQGAMLLRRDPRLGFVDLLAAPPSAPDPTAAPAPQDAAPGARAHRSLGDIFAYITPAQYRLIASALDRPLIIQGKAGSGKTTVALHRVSWLATPEDDDAPAQVAVDRVLVVMFNRALCAFVDTMLKPLGLEKAHVETFHGWALKTIRAVYKGELEVVSFKHPGQAAAARLKAHLGMLRAVDAYVDAQTQRMLAWLRDQLTQLGHLDGLRRFQSDDRPVLQRLLALRREALERRRDHPGDPLAEPLARLYNNAARRMQRYKEDLHALLTDPDLLRANLPEQPHRDIDALTDYQRHLQRVDPRRAEVGRRVEFDDLALLLRIIQVKNGGLPIRSEEEAFRYDHLVIDEAQDFGAVALKVLLESVQTRAGVTIVGDINQKIVPGVDFLGWDAIAAELGFGGMQVAQLTVGHRSTAPIMRLTDTLTDDPTPEPARPGELPLDLVCADAEHTLDTLASRLLDALRLHPDAHHCVVCRNKTEAAQTLASLQRRLPEPQRAALRLGHNDTFSFDPGVTLSTRRQIKGLEFDSVILFEPDPAAFPATAHGRRELYVACSRARERLLFIGHKRRSSLIDDLVARELLQRTLLASPPPLDLPDEEIPF